MPDTAGRVEQLKLGIELRGIQRTELLMSFAELLLSILVATERESEKIKRGEMDVEVDVRERERVRILFCTEWKEEESKLEESVQTINRPWFQSVQAETERSDDVWTKDSQP